MYSTLQTRWHLLHFLHRHELAKSLHKAFERSAGLRSEIYKGQQAMLAECKYQGDHQRHPWWMFCLTQSGHKPRQSHCSHTWHCARCGERHRRRAGVAYWSCHRYDRRWKLSVAHLLAWDCTLGHCCWSDPPRRKTFCRLRSPFPAMACSERRLGRVLSDPLLHHCSRCTASQIIAPFALSLFCCCCCRSALTSPPCCLLALHGSFLSQSHPSSKLPPHIPGTFSSCVERMQRHFICLLCMDHYCRNHILLLKLPPCIPGTFSSCVKCMLRRLIRSNDNNNKKREHGDCLAVTRPRRLKCHYCLFSLSSGTERASPQKIERFPPTLTGFSSHCPQCSSDIYL